VVFVGVAQEKARVPRTVRKHFGQGGTIPWIDYTTAMVNVYYFYCLDEDFGPFFIKFCSYFPYTAKLCLNGHEYLKRQLTQQGVAFEALDNGLLSCSEIAAAQRVSNGLNEKKIEAFFRQWLARLPHPYSPRTAGWLPLRSFHSPGRVLPHPGLDRGVHGRCFFEEVIRENIDLGRPEQVQLIFDRKMQRKTATTADAGRAFSPRRHASLHVYYKNTHLKQYHKEAGHCAPKRPSTTPTILAWVGGCTICPVAPDCFAANRRCWRWRNSVMTATLGRALSNVAATGRGRRPARIRPSFWDPACRHS